MTPVHIYGVYCYALVCWDNKKKENFEGSIGYHQTIFLYGFLLYFAKVYNVIIRVWLWALHIKRDAILE